MYVFSKSFILIIILLQKIKNKVKIKKSLHNFTTKFQQYFRIISLQKNIENPVNKEGDCEFHIIKIKSKFSYH